MREFAQPVRLFHKLAKDLSVIKYQNVKTLSRHMRQLGQLNRKVIALVESASTMGSYKEICFAKDVFCCCKREDDFLVDGSISTEIKPCFQVF